jgi:NitT/TauT family transport system permease protein
MLKVGETMPKRTKLIVEIAGAVGVLLLWWLVADFILLRPSILPSPVAVIVSFKDLYLNNSLIGNAGYSIKLNILGLLEATILAIPLGLIIGLVPV